MYGSMVDIQSAAAEIRRGKKEERKKETTGQKYNGLLYYIHRAAIKALKTKNRLAQTVVPVRDQVPNQQTSDEYVKQVGLKDPFAPPRQNWIELNNTGMSTL